MAGGGVLSPRQKMINMMYLVLTALLAMNVSAEILMSFRTIANSLSLTAKQLDEKNRDLAGELVAILNDQSAKGKDKNQYLRPFIEKARTEATDMVKFLDAHIEKIKNDSIAGWDTTTNSLKNMGESSKNYRYWLIGVGKDTDNEGRGSGKAMPLKDKLNSYVAWANKFRYDLLAEHALPDEKVKPDPNKLWYSKIATDPKDDPFIPDNDDNKKHTWEYYTFHGAPAIANLAMLQKWKTDARVIESQLLEFMKTRIVDRPPFIIKKLEAVVAPKSDVVLAGMPFEAKVFVTMSAEKTSDKKPTFSGTGVKTDKGGMTATIKMAASAKYLSTRDNKQPYSGTIKYPKSDGGFETIPFKGSFTVRKPEAVFESAKLDPLYLLCANELNVDVPALGEMYSPQHTADGGEVKINMKSPKRVLIIPDKAKLFFHVKTKINGEVVEIDKREFRVLKPPPPEIKVLMNGKEWSPTMKISPTATLKVYAVAESQFASALPKDARYSIETMKVLVKRGIGPYSDSGLKFSPSSVSSKTHLEVEVKKIADLNRGASLLIEIDKINRVNFQDKSIEDTELTKLSKSIVGFVE